MRKLIPDTPKAPSNFKQCQICGFVSEWDDICDFRMWQRTDENEKPIEEFFIMCRNDACHDKLEQDDRLFIEVPWGSGGPGRFMLLCGPCKHRDGFSCKHPSLKTNGGEGLLLKFTQALTARVHLQGGGHAYTPNPASFCEGVDEGFIKAEKL